MEEVTTSQVLRRALGASCCASTSLLDVALATQVANMALPLQLGTTTRRVMDNVTAQLVEQVEAFFEAGLPNDAAEAAAQRAEIRALLDRAPGRSGLTVNTWTCMRALGRILRRHGTQYQERHDGRKQGEEGCTEEPEPSRGQLRGMYRVPSGLVTVSARRQLSLTGGDIR